MHTIYALESTKDHRIYIGFTQNLERRLAEHNAGHVFSTKGFRPWKVIYTEFVASRNEARVREKYWKSGIGKEKLKNRSQVAQR
jgi:putative endonuclease